MTTREIIAWLIALPVATFGAVCMPMIALGLPWIILLPGLLVGGLTIFILLNNEEVK